MFSLRATGSADSKEWEHFSNIFTLSPNHFPKDFPSPIIEAPWVERARTLVCILQTATSVGQYTDGAPAIKFDWKVRLVAWPSKDVLVEKEFSGGEPPETKYGSGSGFGSIPINELYQWLFSIVSGETILFVGDFSPVDSIVFSPDGKYLATRHGTGRDEIMIWDITNQEKIHSINLDFPVNAITFSSDGKTLLVGDSSELVMFFNITTGQQDRTIMPQDVPTTLVVSPDSQLLAVGGYSGALEIWDMANGLLIDSIQTPGLIVALAFSRDGNSLLAISIQRTSTGGPEGVWTLWNVVTKQVAPTFNMGEMGEVDDIVISLDSRRIATIGIFEDIKLWNGETTDLANVFPNTSGSLLAFSPDGKVLASTVYHLRGSDQQGAEIKIWDVATGQMIHSFDTGATRILSLAFSPDSMILASGDNAGAIKLWEIPTGQ